MHSWNIQKYRANHFDSTQDSLNIDTYMRDNSTLAIQEVDEEDLDYGIANPKAVKPRDLPHLEHSPKVGDSNNQETIFRFPNFILKKTNNHILIENNEQYNKIPLACHQDKKW